MRQNGAKQMKILISCPRGRTFDSFFTYKNLRLLESIGECVYNPLGANFGGELAGELVADCEVYVTTWGAPSVDKSFLKAAERLRVIVHLGGSSLPMDWQEIDRRGIQVLSGERYYAMSAAEGVLSYILSALRKIFEYSARIKYNHDWPHSWDRVSTLVGKTVGIINYNSISRELSRILGSFDVDVIMYDKMGVPVEGMKDGFFEVVTLKELCMRSNVISVHTPRYVSYRPPLDSLHLSFLAEGTLIVDTSSGGVINRNSLLSLMMNRKIYAMLDIYESELSVLESIPILQNLTVMPHISGVSTEVRPFLTKKLLIECKEYLLTGRTPKNFMTRDKVL